MLWTNLYTDAVEQDRKYPKGPIFCVCKTEGVKLSWYEILFKHGKEEYCAFVQGENENEALGRFFKVHETIAYVDILKITCYREG